MGSRDFTVGETVRLRIRVSAAGTKQAATPADPVALVRLAKDGAPIALPTATQFGVLSEGLYELPLATDTLPPGTYSWMARVSSGSNAVSLPEDAFILVAPATPA